MNSLLPVFIKSCPDFKSRGWLHSVCFLCLSQTRISARGYHTVDPSTYCCCAEVFVCVNVFCVGGVGVRIEDSAAIQ